MASGRRDRSAPAVSFLAATASADKRRPPIPPWLAAANAMGTECDAGALSMPHGVLLVMSEELQIGTGRCRHPREVCRVADFLAPVRPPGMGV